MMGKRMCAQFPVNPLRLRRMVWPASSAGAQQASWTPDRHAGCKVDPSIGFVIFGHQSMSCRFTQNPLFPTQLYEGALNTV